METNKKNAISIYPRDELKLYLETIAREQERSLNFIVLKILEEFYSNDSSIKKEEIKQQSEGEEGYPSFD